MESRGVLVHEDWRNVTDCIDPETGAVAPVTNFTELITKPPPRQPGKLICSFAHSVFASLRAPNKTSTPAPWVRTLQLRVLRLGFLQDGDVGVGVFPERGILLAGVDSYCLQSRRLEM
jgi:hypothetical protein